MGQPTKAGGARAGDLLRVGLVLVLPFMSLGGALAPALAAPDGGSFEASVCRMIDDAARGHGLPITFLTRLIWQESSFRAAVTSPAGAQGIAQFMPATAGERGLSHPFDPEEAIPKAAELLADLDRRFGNLGLAAAAYNAGASRVASWLAGQGGLPPETRAYVLVVTGRSVDDWQAGAASGNDDRAAADRSCVEEIALVRDRHPAEAADAPLLAPWGVQLAGSFSKVAAVAAYAERRAQLASVLGETSPMVIGGRLPSRGYRPYYRVRFPAPSRARAIVLCDKIMRLGGACSVARS